VGRHNRFRIGLKGLTDAIAGLDGWREDLQRCHQRLASAGLGLVEAIVSVDEEPGYAPGYGRALPWIDGSLARHRLRYLLAHTEYAGDEPSRKRLIGQPYLLELLYAQVGGVLLWLLATVLTLSGLLVKSVIWLVRKLLRR
jgi:hypothetical protein